MGRKIPYVVLSVCFCFLIGCMTRMVVTPEVNSIENVDFKLKGNVIYDGNAEYLPGTITNDPVPEAVLTFQYTYNVVYGRDNMPQLLPLWSPLTGLGFPIGEDTLVVIGKLDVLKGREVIKSYSSTCGFEKTRSLFFEGKSFSELRKNGLIAVRDNIEVQMYQDRNSLSQLINPSISQTTKGEL